MHFSEYQIMELHQLYNVFFQEAKTIYFQQIQLQL